MRDKKITMPSPTVSWNEILAKSTTSFGFSKSHTIKNFQLVQSYFL